MEWAVRLPRPLAAREDQAWMRIWSTTFITPGAASHIPGAVLIETSSLLVRRDVIWS